MPFAFRRELCEQADLPAMHSSSLRARHHRAQCSIHHIPKIHICVCAPSQTPIARKLLSCSAAADASILQDQSPGSAQGQQQEDQAVQQPQRLQQQQQLQDGLLGPLTSPTAAAEGDPLFEADRVVERELLDSNGA